MKKQTENYYSGRPFKQMPYPKKQINTQINKSDLQVTVHRDKFLQ